MSLKTNIDQSWSPLKLAWKELDWKYVTHWTWLPFVGHGGLGSGGLVVDAVGVHPVVEVEPWDI